MNTTIALGFALATSIGTLGCAVGDGTAAGRPQAHRDVDSGARQGPADSPDEPSVPCAATVSGTVRFPNGEQPMPGAMVYALPRDGELPSRSGTCQQCIAAAAIAHVLTDARGAFSLPITPNEQDLIIEKGSFRRRVPLNTSACGASIALEDEQTRLPRNAEEGDVPRIAVVTGNYDQMEDVLAKLGLGDTTVDGNYVRGTGIIDTYTGRGGEFDDKGLPLGSLIDLLHNPAQLASYDAIVIDCGNTFESQFLWDWKAMTALRNFVADGGRLYATDWSYDFIEGLFPEKLAFVTSNGAGLSTTPEAENHAQGGTVSTEERTGRVLDPQLQAWLDGLGVLDEEQGFPLHGFLSEWSVMAAFQEGAVKEWVQGNGDWGWSVRSSGYDYYKDTYITGTENTPPMTVTFEHGCGRVLYSSYHTAEQTYDPETGMVETALVPQELILGYLLFEISTCVEDAVIY